MTLLSKISVSFVTGGRRSEERRRPSETQTDGSRGVSCQYVSPSSRTPTSGPLSLGVLYEPS